LVDAYLAEEILDDHCRLDQRLACHRRHRDAAAPRLRRRRRRQWHQGRYKLLTPHPATPSAVAKTIAAVVNEFGWTGPLGVTYPGVVTDGLVRTAANVDKKWIGTDAQEIISAGLNGQEVVVLNDADAAGLAEERYGAGKDTNGVVVLLTFGTGIGSAVIHNGILLPNTEFGHLEVGGKEAEHRAASSVRDKRGWSYGKWAKQVTKVLVAIENAMCPELFIAGCLTEHRRNRRRGDGGDARRDALICVLWRGYCPAVVTMVTGSRPTDSGEYPP
jgi:hypothetical protein